MEISRADLGEDRAALGVVGALLALDLWTTWNVRTSPAILYDGRTSPTSARRPRPARGLPPTRSASEEVRRAHDELSRLRNVVLAGHAGSGKTTLAEHLLHATGAITRLGRVDDGTASLDFEPEEQKRKLSLSLAVGDVRPRRAPRSP